MPITHDSQFDRARRQLYLTYEDPPRRVGGVDFGQSTGRGKIPRFLPVSAFIDGSDHYIETNGFFVKINSTDAFEDLYFIPSTSGEVEFVEVGNYNQDFFAVDDRATRLHGFNRL